jgi:alanine racemase
LRGHSGIAARGNSWKQMRTLNPPASSLHPPRTWAEIDLTALRHNLAAVRAQIGARVGIMAIVKANAYGHDATLIAPAIADAVEMFGVANLREACEVRTVAPERPVFILGPALPEERAGIVAERFIPTVSNLDEANAFAALAGTEPLDIHLKLDTGMGRIGIWQDDAIEIVRAIRALSGVRIAGLASHLPVADEDDIFTRKQLEHFEQLVARLRLEGVASPIVHVANSAGIIGFPAQAGDLVRPGLILYGSDMENARGAGPRSRRGPLLELWPHFHHRPTDARRDTRGGLRRWLPAAPFQSWRRSAHRRPALRGARARDDGPNSRRRERAAGSADRR